MGQDAIAQLSELLAKAGELRKSLSNGERLQAMGLAGAFLGELERPDEAVFRMTFNDVGTLPHGMASERPHSAFKLLITVC